jgi:hypothetical protein
MPHWRQVINLESEEGKVTGVGLLEYVAEG